jgi:hypothetical protein
MSLPNIRDCYYCLEGNQPAGTHRILGPVYRPCGVCLAVCPLCEGQGLFPADFTCWHCLALFLATLGLAPVICHGCTGIVDLLPLDTTHRVVSPHDD